MQMSYSVTTLAAPHYAPREARYMSFDEAILEADLLLSSGSSSVWIVDRVAEAGWIASAYPVRSLVADDTDLVVDLGA